MNDNRRWFSCEKNVLRIEKKRHAELERELFIVMTNHNQLPQLSSITTQLHVAYLSNDVFNTRIRQLNRRKNV